MFYSMSICIEETNILLYVNLHRAKAFWIDILLYVNLYRAKGFRTDILRQCCDKMCIDTYMLQKVCWTGKLGKQVMQS